MRGRAAGARLAAWCHRFGALTLFALRRPPLISSVYNFIVVVLARIIKLKYCIINLKIKLIIRRLVAAVFLA